MIIISITVIIVVIINFTGFGPDSTEQWLFMSSRLYCSSSIPLNIIIITNVIVRGVIFIIIIIANIIIIVISIVTMAISVDFSLI